MSSRGYLPDFASPGSEPRLSATEVESHFQTTPDGPAARPPAVIQPLALRRPGYSVPRPQPRALRPRSRAKGLVEVLRENFLRICLFTFVGLSVFMAGLALQITLSRYAELDRDQSRIVQIMASIQLNFLLSRYITWRDRATSFFGAFGRFNLQQLGATSLGLLACAGLEQFKMNHVTAEVVVTASLAPVSFLLSHNWSMTERESRVTFKTLPWPLFLVLAVQILLSLRLIFSNTPYIDEATYLYAGGQELSHWIHGIPVEDYQDYFSGSPAVYPPLGAIASALGGLSGARALSLGFMLGTTSLLYFTTKKFFGISAAFLGTAVFASLGVTQFLSALATYDSMALFLLALASYLAIGREHTYNTLTDVALSTTLAASLLALANACKYASALWDPVVIGLALCAPPVAGHTWRYGRERAIRFVVVLVALLTVGVAVGKAKYIQGIMYTTLNRSSTNIGMGQSAPFVIRDVWQWGDVLFVLTATGALMLLIERKRGPFSLVGLLLLLASIAAPLNQARIGTTTSLQKHVVFGAWFGCIIAGYALSRLLRYRWLPSVGAIAILICMSVFYMNQADGLFHTWSAENPSFIKSLKKYLHPGTDKYLIEGFADVPEYYIGPKVASIQWKESGSYSFFDRWTGEELYGPAAITAAVQNKIFSAIILNFTPTSAIEIADDDAVPKAIAKFGGYRIVGKLPPSRIGSHAMYTVWERTES